MYLVIWEYRVRAGCQKEFEKMYSPNGLWARLFRRGAGYLNTELIHDPKNRSRYLTIDRWISSEAYDAFRANWREDYDALAAHCARLIEREAQLGAFTEL